MKNLWVYGDSFSMDMNNDTAPYAIEYVKLKNRHVKNYGNFISEKLGLNLINRAIGGIDNFTILETFCLDIENIHDDDLVIIGWAPQTRFRMVNDLTNDWVPIGSVCDDFEPTIGKESIQKIIINRLHELYGMEIENWNKLIKKSLPKNFLYTWTWYHMEFTNKFKNILDETNGLINDIHWSEIGHRDFSNYVLEIYNEWKDKQK